MKARVRAAWQGTVLVCRKCSKKLDGGFGPDGDQRLAKALARATGGGAKRKARLGVVEVGCVGICPKRAVVALNAAQPDEWLLVQPGTPVDEVVSALGIAPAAARA